MFCRGGPSTRGAPPPRGAPRGAPASRGAPPTRGGAPSRGARAAAPAAGYDGYSSQVGLIMFYILVFVLEKCFGC